MITNFNIFDKYKYSIMGFFIALTSIMMSCNTDDNYETDKHPENNRKLFTVEAYFNFPENQNKRYPDVGAKVYIYFDIPTYEFNNSTYLGEGVYENRNRIIEPDTIYTIDGNGSIIIKNSYPEKDITIIIESNKMKPVNSFHLYSPLNPPEKIVTVFTVTN